MEITINLTIELPELGKQTLGGHKQNFVHTKAQEKGAVTPQEISHINPLLLCKVCNRTREVHSRA